MLNIAAIFLIVSVVAAVFGFGGAANAVGSGAKIFFMIFLALAFIAFIF